MAFTTILKIDNEEYRLLSYSNHIFYPYPHDIMFDWGSLETRNTPAFKHLRDFTHPLSVPYAYRPHSYYFGGVFTVVFESRGKEDMFHFCMSQKAGKHEVRGFSGLIEFYNGKEEDIAFQTVEFFDAFISEFSESFSSTSSSPMTMQLTISPATIRYNKSIVFQQNWWVTDINRSNAIASSENEPEIINLYWMDEEQQKRIDDVKSGQIAYLIVETIDFEDGDKVTIPIKDDKTNKEFTLEGYVDAKGIAEIKWTKPKEEEKQQTNTI